jgi:hypothetical protein
MMPDQMAMNDRPRQDQKHFAQSGHDPHAPGKPADGQAIRDGARA